MSLITPGIDLLGLVFAAVAAVFWVFLYIASLLSARFGCDLATWKIALGTLLIALISFAIRVTLVRLRHKRHAASMGAQLVPEPQGRLPGNLDLGLEIIYKLQTAYPGDGMREQLAVYGPVVNWRAMWTNMIFTTSPEHIKIILATDFQNYVKGVHFQANLRPLLGTGVFNSDGDMWKFHRSITRPMFTRERIGHFEIFDKYATEAISKLKERMHEGYAVDFQDLMSRFTLDAATSFLFGHNVQSLSADLPYPQSASYTSSRHTPEGDAANAFADAFLKAQEVVSLRERFDWPWWPLTEMFRDKVREPMKIVNSYIEPIVKEALRKKTGPGQSPGKDEGTDDDETLLDQLVRVTSDPVILKDEILNIMIAGRDTTASTLTFIVYFLSIYPDVLARLREEIITKVGHTRRPDYDDIRDMKYLRAVINETLRLFPVVPFNVRESVNAATWPSENPDERPYYIPAGTRTTYSVFLMHRRKDLWGPDAEEFDPDRFLDDRLKNYLAKNPFIFLPFNAGPRICLGQQFAYNEMSFMIIRLLQSFSSMELDLVARPPEAIPPKDWVHAEGRKAVEKLYPKFHLTMYTRGGLWVRMNEGDGVN